MLLQRILTIASRKIQDSSYDDEALLDFVNLCVGELASTEALPKLRTNAELVITAGSDRTALPDDYMKGPLYAYNTTKDVDVEIYKHLPEFLEEFEGLDGKGNVLYACQHIDELLVQYVPSESQTVKLWYFAEPEDITSEVDDDLLYFIPKTLRGPLLINYLCMSAYEEIEDGIDKSGMPNYEKFYQRYQMAVSQLRQYLGLPDDTPDFVLEVRTPHTEDF